MNASRPSASGHSSGQVPAIRPDDRTLVVLTCLAVATVLMAGGAALHSALRPEIAELGNQWLASGPIGALVSVGQLVVVVAGAWMLSRSLSRARAKPRKREG